MEGLTVTSDPFAPPECCSPSQFACTRSRGLPGSVMHLPRGDPTTSLRTSTTSHCSHTTVAFAVQVAMRSSFGYLCVHEGIRKQGLFQIARTRVICPCRLLSMWLRPVVLALPVPRGVTVRLQSDFGTAKYRHQLTGGGPHREVCPLVSQTRLGTNLIPCQTQISQRSCAKPYKSNRLASRHTR